MTIRSVANQVAIQFDKACDFAPGISTVSNLVDLFEKSVSLCVSAKIINSNRYFGHIVDKPLWRCFVLLVPILGNIVIAVYDVHKYRLKRSDYSEARKLGIDLKDLPDDPARRRQFIERKRIEPIEVQKEVIVDIPIENPLIQNLKDAIAEFNHILSYRDEVETPLEKQNDFWSSLTMRLKLPIQLETNEEMIGLETQLLEIRRTSYTDLITQLDQDSFLQEAREQLLASYKPPEREAKKATINRATAEELLPQLQDRCLDLKKNPYALVEMQAILVRMEKVQ